MDEMITLIAKGVGALIDIYANHTGKPEGWKPTQQDLTDLLAEVDSATPAAEKAAARARLGLPPK
jgi:hypothetical protein